MVLLKTFLFIFHIFWSCFFFRPPSLSTHHYVFSTSKQTKPQNRQLTKSKIKTYKNHKKKKIKNKTKQRSTQKKNGIGFCFVFTKYSWTWCLTEVWLIYPGSLPSRNLIFLFASEYQFQIASWLGVGPVSRYGNK